MTPKAIFRSDSVPIRKIPSRAVVNGAPRTPISDTRRSDRRTTVFFPRQVLVAVTEVVLPELRRHVAVLLKAHESDSRDTRPVLKNRHTIPLFQSVTSEIIMICGTESTISRASAEGR